MAETCKTCCGDAFVDSEKGKRWRRQEVAADQRTRLGIIKPVPCPDCTPGAVQPVNSLTPEPVAAPAPDFTPTLETPAES